MKQLKKIKAVVFDWSGTTVDFGCRAPLYAIMKIFKDKNIPLTEEEAIGPMGTTKIDHFRDLFKLERVQQEYFKLHGKYPDESSVLEFYSLLNPILAEILPDNSTLIPEVVNTVNELRNKYGLKIGSTTGFTREMLNYVYPIAESQGYKPDLMITPNDVSKGRPYPYMIYLNSMKLDVPDLETIIKVGDTPADINEGRSAGCWSGGIIDGSTTLGYSLEQFKKAEIQNKSELNAKRNKAKKIYESLKADFVLNSIADLPEQIELINQKLANGELPGGKIQANRQIYTLFTPGPLTTSLRVKIPLLIDHGSRETEFVKSCQEVRKELVRIALNDSINDKLTNEELSYKYTSVLMQGSGTFGVEATVSSVVPKSGKILVIMNGAYGKRMYQIAKTHKLDTVSLEYDESAVPSLEEIDNLLTKDKSITHVGVIHSETTTGILNPIKDIAKVVKSHNKKLIVDAMSSFGAVPIDVHTLGIDFLISSTNKNIQGIPGLSYVICPREELLVCKDTKEFPPKTVSLDLYDQYNFHEKNSGGFRFTPPVHVISSFREALKELDEEGGIDQRFIRYSSLQRRLTEGMREMNFKELDLKGYQGPIITTFHTPKCPQYNFEKFYQSLKEKQSVIYPGKLTKSDTFRIGSIGHIGLDDIEKLLKDVEESIFWDNRL